MSLYPKSAIAAGIAACAAAFVLAPFDLPVRAEGAAHALPAPLADVAPGRPGLRTAVFAGGCFWGVQAVFQHVAGVRQAVSGYAAGQAANPSYEQVSRGRTGHAEAVLVTYDPAEVSYGKLLQIFFTVALDPTQVDRQGPDWGTQYRSELFVGSPDEARAARAYVAQLEAAHAFSAPIATRIGPAAPFYPAESYHQDYLQRHPDNPYIARNDLPKVQALQALFPESWREAPVTSGKLASGG